ncbi:hypothetical protein HYFRA_00001077 [Hymenoscyphus fraxineus]|uniref:Uncharacterized protein n=1 Tax=Hymenoscyphus fraxineus TaxID=746836 RepID=A0A9N9KVL4_9HELO|nr:hypothetical protein HYFRA_00001077 [Hymenoscyphus fraxineus]
MCYFKRYLFSCSHHSSWGAEVRTCRLQETFREGINDEACTAQWAHPRMTYILPEPCPKCAVERAAEEEERKARVEEWRTKDEEAKKRREELDRKREATLKDLHDKLEEARSKMKKWEKYEESGFEDDEESTKENESWDVEVETLSQSSGRSPTRRESNKSLVSVPQSFNVTMY